MNKAQSDPAPGAVLPDINRLRAYRLARVRAELRRQDIGAIVLANPINIRYATDARNMAVWTLHSAARYVFLPVEGPIVLFEFQGANHICRDLPSIGEVRPATNWSFFTTGARAGEMALRWATELADLARTSGCGPRLAIDRCDPAGAAALGAAGHDLVDGQALMERARMIKSGDEIACVRESIVVAETALERIRVAIVPGVTENALWSLLNQTNSERGGEWIETRLLCSGERTVPW